LPWVLCWLSLALMAAGVWLSIAFPDGQETTTFYVVVQVSGIVLVPPVGALIAARQPGNAYGWVWCALGFVYGGLAFLDGIRRTDAVPEWIPMVLIGASFEVFTALLVFVLLLFPTGRLPGAAWRWLARVTVVVAGAALLVVPFSPPFEWAVDAGPWAAEGRAGDAILAALNGSITVMFLLILGAAASVLLRFRRAGPVERQQLKWFVFAAFLASVAILVDLTGVAIDEPLWAVLDSVSFALLPLSVGIAVLRYRLFEIDRIISRTVSYGLLTAVLIGLYLLVVALLRPLLEPLTGSSALAVAASTLAVAAVFNPARRRLQAAVDRRFDRARYDARRAVDAFAARLRGQVDLDEVIAGLRETVAATVAPTRVAVWLRVPAGTVGS
jgi:hypothetical protein